MLYRRWIFAAIGAGPIVRRQVDYQSLPDVIQPGFKPETVVQRSGAAVPV